MADFYQHRLVTTLHHLREIDLKEQDRLLSRHAKRRPITLILPACPSTPCGSYCVENLPPAARVLIIVLPTSNNPKNNPQKIDQYWLENLIEPWCATLIHAHVSRNWLFLHLTDDDVVWAHRVRRRDSRRRAHPSALDHAHQHHRCRRLKNDSYICCQLCRWQILFNKLPMRKNLKWQFIGERAGLPSRKDLCF